MKKTLLKKQIPTIIGLLILFIGAGAGVILVGDRVPFLPRAAPEYAPRNIQVSNVSHDTFTVSWVTDQATSGFLQYGDTQSLGSTAIDVRDEISGDSVNYKTHYVTVKNLQPQTTYYFQINSGSSVYDNQGSLYQVDTGPVLGAPTSSATIYGKVLTQAQVPADGAIVYLKTGNSAIQSVMVRNSGDWSLPLASLRTGDFSEYFNLANPEIIFNLDVISLEGQVTAGVVDAANSQPVPAIVLGEPFDFRQNQSEDSQSNEDEDQELESNQENNTQESETEVIKLLNPSFDGEALNTTRPEIQGEAPANIELSITVESPVTYQDQIVTDSTGNFTWTPPDDLEPGNHTITISWIEDGVRKFIQRNFVVMAQGESNLPALTSTPSATPVPTPTPTPTPTPSATPVPTPTPTPTPRPTTSPTPTSTSSGRVSQPSTASGVPVAGSGAYSFMMLAAGAGLIGLGWVLSAKLAKSS